MSADAAREAPVLRVLDRAAMAANVAGSALIVGLMVLIGADVAGRNLFGAPISGVPEIVSLSIVAIVFLQAPQTLGAGRMPRASALPDALARRAPRAARLLEDAWDLLGAAMLAILAWSVWPNLVRDYERGTFVGAVGDFTAPTWPVEATIVIGSALLVLVFLARIWRRHRGAGA